MRVQGAFVSEGEVDAVVSFIKEKNSGQSHIDDAVLKEIEAQAAMCGVKKGSGGGAAAAGGASADGEDDPLLRGALEVAFESGKISTSLLQRRLSVGYGRAAKLIDKMEEMGYVSAPDGQKPRELLISKQDYMELLVKKED
jgi:S-DNA-T family DNA segregation ATPase FtsK/SpoIIIE